MPFTPETAHTGTQFQPGKSGNPNGLPKGTKHISTWIRKGLEAELELEDLDGRKFKGMPIEAIVQVAIKRSLDGDNKWAEWLAKHGYAQKLQLGNDPDNPLTNANNLTDEQLDERIEQLIRQRKG